MGTGKAWSLTSSHGRSLQDPYSNTDEEGRKKARAPSPSSKKSARKGRVRGQSRPANRRRSGKGASVPDWLQQLVHGCAAVAESPARVGVPRMRFSPNVPELACESVYGAARPPRHRLRTTGASQALTAQKRDCLPHPPAPPRQHAGSVRSSAGASAGARKGRTTTHDTAQQACGAVAGRAPVGPGERLRHSHAVRTSWQSARPTCCVTTSLWECLPRRLICAGMAGSPGPRMLGNSQATVSSRAAGHWWTGSSVRGQNQRRNAASDRLCKSRASLAALLATNACHGLPGFRRWLPSTRSLFRHSSVLPSHARQKSTPCATQGDVRPRILLFAGPPVLPLRPTWLIAQRRARVAVVVLITLVQLPVYWDRP